MVGERSRERSFRDTLYTVHCKRACEEKGQHRRKNCPLPRVTNKATLAIREAVQLIIRNYYLNNIALYPHQLWYVYYTHQEFWTSPMAKHSRFKRVAQTR